MLYLKADTNVEVLVGPAVAVGDGFTPVTNLSLSTADEAELIKYNGATALTVTDISSNTMAAITGADGYYTLDLSTGNLDTEGPLTILINDDSLILPIRLDFMVVNANVYDSLFAAATTDYLQTDVAQYGGSAGTFSGGRPEVNTSHWAGTATTLSSTTSKPEVDVNSISDDATAANNAQLMFDGTGYAGGTTKLDVNVAQISTDSTAADNLEAMFDGTGYVDPTAPSSRSQLDNLSVGSGGIATTAESVTIDTGGGTETNAYTDTVQENGTYHIIDVATDIDFYYQFNIGATGVPIECRWVGYAQSNNDNIEVYAYNYGATSYEQIGTIAGTTGTTVQSADFIMTTAHVGTSGADLGKVRLRFESTGADIATRIATDRVLCEYTAVQAALGFVNGAVWIDTNAGTAGTGEGVGTITTPSSNIDDAMTIAAANNLSDLHIAPNSTVTPTGAVANYEIFGHEYTVDLNGQSWAGTYINGATVAASTATGSGIQFESCIFDANVTLPPCVMRFCYWGNMTITAGSVGNYYFNDCRSRVAGSDSPTFDFSTGFNTGLSIRSYSGGITLTNMASGDTASIEGTGAITESACTAGAVALRGAFKQNSITNITITQDDVKENLDSILTDTGTDGVVIASGQTVATVTDVTNEVSADVTKISGDATAADNLEASMETLVTGTATGGDTGEVQSAVTGHGDDTFNGRVLIFRTGTLQYEAGVITDYDSTAGTFTFAASTWTTPPTTETFVIV